MLKKTDQVTLIISCSILAILGGLVITFFGSIISGFGGNQQIQNIKNGMSNLPFRKWVLMGVVLNILIIMTYFLMYLRIGKTKEGVTGIKGDKGERGNRGTNFSGCC